MELTDRGEAQEEQLRPSSGKEDELNNGEICSETHLGLTGKNDTEWGGRETGRKRKMWTNKYEFLLSCIAMSVGLGNIWRFPFTAIKNGGGAFLIPYLIVLVLVGRPIYFLELALGQFASCGHIKIWKMFPFLKGVGVSASFASVCSISYYYSLMASALYYLYASFHSTLPWTVCKPEWPGVTTCFHNGSALVSKNLSDPLSMGSASVPSLFYKHEVLREKDQIEDGIGLPEWRLTVCLFVFWLLVFGSIIRGVKSSGKAAYFTALFPYVCLLVMLVRGLLLPGSWKGIVFFFEPQWKALLDPVVWIAAIDQCFFSLATGFGPVIVYASYNPFNHDIYKDAIILSCVDTFTSILSGCTVFAVLGYLSQDLDIDIQSVTSGNSAIAFDTYPLVISKFGWLPQMYAVLFFLMLISLGLGSGVSDASGLMTAVQDQFPHFSKIGVRCGVCLFGFLTGLLYLTPGGQWMLELVDHYGCMMIITLTVCLEVMGIAWFYGLANIIRDMEYMLNRKIGLYLKVCWGFVVPVGITVCMTYYLCTSSLPTHNHQDYPVGATYAGQILTTIGLSIIPACAIHTVIQQPGDSILEKLRGSFRPAQSWGPQLPVHRKGWIALPQPESYLEKFKRILRF